MFTYPLEHQCLTPEGRLPVNIAGRVRMYPWSEVFIPGNLLLIQYSFVFRTCSILSPCCYSEFSKTKEEHYLLVAFGHYSESQILLLPGSSKLILDPDRPFPQNNLFYTDFSVSLVSHTPLFEVPDD